MHKLFKLVLSLALLCAFSHAQKLDLANETKGVLPRARGGTGSTSAGVNGQVLICDGVSACVPGDPIVSFNFANLLTTQSATGTAVGAAVRLSTFGSTGTLYVTFASITGSGTSCTVQLKNYDSLGNAINNGSAISVTPANGTTTSAVSPALALQTAAQMSATYACSAYPSAGTITVDFVPGVSVGIAGTISVNVANFPATQAISAVSLPLPTGAATSANQPALVNGRTPVDPSGVTSPVSAASLPLPSGASQEHTGATSFNSTRLTDGTTFYKGTTPADTQPISAASLPLPTGAAQDATLTGGTTKAINRGGAKGSTTAADVTSTASGVNHQALDAALYDASGNQLGLSATPLRTDPTGTTTQPVSGTVTANIGTSGSLALDASVTALEVAQASTTSGQKGVLIQGSVTTAAPTDTTAQTAPISLTTSGAVRTDETSIAGTATLTGNGTTGPGSQRVTVASDNTAFGVKPTDGTNTITVKAASTQAAATDTSLVVQLNPNQSNLTTPLNVRGAKTNNNAAPDATEIGDLPALANSAPPSSTEGNEVKLSIDLKGNLRVNNHPPDVLGCYMVNGRTGVYGGQAALSPLFSFRWGDATHFAVIQSVKINVATTTAATAATQAERELIIARSFTVSDTGGTAVTMTGNNQKMRTSQATSLVTNIQFGQPLTAGTRTLDANPISSIVSFLATNMTGMDIGCGSGGPFVSGTAWTCVGGLGMVPLLDVYTGDFPIVLAQNEGIIVRIGKDAQPTSAVQQTYVTVKWCEVNAF